MRKLSGLRLVAHQRFLALFLLAGNLPAAAAQQPSRAPVEKPRASLPASLPSDCLSRKGASQQIADLLDTVQDHPTAGACNTLGALFAQQGRDRCAISAFEASLRLDNNNWEAHYNLAVALIKRGNRSRATAELHSAIQQKPDSANAHFALAILFQEEKKMDEAEQEFMSVLSIDSNFVPASLSLADLLLAQKKYPAAIQCLEKVLALAPPPDQAEALTIALGASYARSGDIKKATDLLKAFLADHPQSAQAHFHLGLLYAQNGQPADYDAGINEYETALRLDPLLHVVRLSLATAFVATEKYSAALPVLQEYIRSAPRDPQGYYQQGLAYGGLKKWNDAVASFSRSARLNPANYDVRLALGSALAHAGKTVEAISEFQAAATLNPKAPEVHHQLALLLDKRQPDLAKKESARFETLQKMAGDLVQAARWTEKGNQSFAAGDSAIAADSYRKALRFDSRSAQLHYNLSLALDRLGDRKGERIELQKALQLDPAMAAAHNQLGLLDLGLHLYPEAEKEFKAALQINPQFAEAQNNLGVLYDQQGKDVEAASLFQQTVQNDPKYSRAYVNLGLILARHGDYARAEQDFQSAIRTDPGNAGAYSALGMLQAKTGRGPDAIASFRKVVTLEPGSADAHVNLGVALVDQYDRNAGVKEFEEAARLNPNSAAVHFNLGRFYFETSDYETARRELETACRLQPDYAEALYFLALVERQSNNLHRVSELLQNVVRLEPQNAEAQFLLGQSLDRLEMTSEAVKHWKMALQVAPNHLQSLYNLARTLAKLHDPAAPEFQQRFDDLQKTQQIMDRVEQLGNLALEAANAQNWPQAIEQMKEAIELCNQCADGAHLHRNLGLFYFRTGKINDAQQELRKAIDLDPNDGDARKALAMLQNLRDPLIK